MAIATLDELFSALKAAPITLIRKSTITAQASGSQASWWKSAGSPNLGATPTSAAICDASSSGAVPLPSRSGSQERILALSNIANNLANATLMIEDRLAHMGGLSGTSTSAQTVNLDITGSGSNLIQRVGLADYSECTWFLEWYATTGATVATPSVAVTYHDNTTDTLNIDNLTTAALPASVAAGRRYQIIPNGKFIKSVQSVTLSASTGAAGNFGVTATRQLAVISQDAQASKRVTYDWASLGSPLIYDNACLQFATICAGNSTGQIDGRIAMAVG